MIDPENTSGRKPSNAGGFVIAAAVLVGVVIGLIVGQPSIGFLVGLGIGVAIAVGIWWRERG